MDKLFGDARVYRTLKTETGETVVVEATDMFGEINGIPSWIIRQVSALKELNHPNIIRLLRVGKVDEEKIQLFFEYWGRRLSSCLEVNSFIIGLDVKDFMRQILDAVAHFHSHKILHRNLNPDTIIVSRDRTPKVAGFEVCREIGVPRNTYSSAENLSLHYLAPEILLGDLQYSYPVDIWAIGCIFAELGLTFSGGALFGSNLGLEIHQLDKIFSIMGTPDENSWPGCTQLSIKPLDTGKSYYPQDLSKLVLCLDRKGIDLLSKMLCLDPFKRITAADALTHPYFN